MKMMSAVNRKPIKFRSKKMAKKYREQRVPLVAELLAAIRVCERCGMRESTEVHEIKSRARGGSITDLKNLAVLCHECHAWITTHPKEATAQGWLKNSWDD